MKKERWRADAKNSNRGLYNSYPTLLAAGYDTIDHLQEKNSKQRARASFSNDRSAASSVARPAAHCDGPDLRVYVDESRQEILQLVGRREAGIEPHHARPPGKPSYEHTVLFQPLYNFLD